MTSRFPTCEPPAADAAGDTPAEDAPGRHPEREDLSRRRFLEVVAGGALGVSLAASLTGCPDDGRVEALPDGGDIPDAPDFTDVDYPRGDNPVFAPSPVAPADPGAVDGGRVLDFEPEAVNLDLATFALGVQAGRVTGDGAELWTHVADAAPRRLRVWRELEAPDRVALVHDLEVTPDAAGYVHVPVHGLAAGTVYRYAFFEAVPGTHAEPGAAPQLVARSAIGRLRTAFLDDGVGPLTIAATSCTHADFRPYTSLRLMAEARPDLVLHLGDLDYADAYTLEEYRAKYHTALQDPDMQAFLQAGSFVMAWDDHEVADAWSAEDIDPVQLENARQAYRENLAVYVDGARLWTSYRWGRTAELFVLDTRSDRRPSTRFTRQAEFLGPAQMAWLKQGLRDSPARFKLVLNSVPMANLQGARASFHDDQRWQGFQHQRNELIDFVTANNIRDVWFLSGDLHVGFVARLDREGAQARLWEIAPGPGAQEVNNFAEAVARGTLSEDEIYPRDMYRYWSAHGTVATLITLDPTAATLHVRFIDGDTHEVLFDQVIHQLD